MPRGHRPERLGEEIRDAIALIVARELKDPRIGFVTVTRVELTSDLAYARAYVGVLGDAARRKEALKALQQATGFVRRELGRRVRMRVLPELRFEYDAGLEASERVARLLDETKAQPSSGDDPGDDED